LRRSELSSFNTYTFFKLPSAWWTGVRLTKLDDTQAVVSVKYRWVNQNPFGSMFWAVQGMAAELSTAVFLMYTIRKSKQAVSMLVLNNQAVFKKKAKGLIKFHCTQGKKAVEAVQKAISNGKPITVKLKSVGTDPTGDIVSEFEFEWSLKKKSK
tara:strand:+ start:1120 stop:1581 length:462 start_codon:yes stop_codon:yes gene_type:complete